MAQPYPPAQYPPQGVPAGPQKSFLAAWLLSLLLGFLAVDRFYLGKVGTGILKLVTFGGLGLWYLIDLILILAGAAKDKRGMPLQATRTHRRVAWGVTAGWVILGMIFGATTAGADESDADDEAAASEEDGAGSESEDEAEDKDQESSAQSEDEGEDSSGASEEEREEDPAPADEEAPSSEGEDLWFDDQYGAFDAVQEAGAGDSVISLPDAEGGIVVAEHQGASNFVLNVLDETNQSTGDLLVNTIGSYSGATAWGLTSFGEGVTLEITADGSWSVEIIPFSEAEAVPESGSGDGVYLHEGDAAVLEATHDGTSNFVVREGTDALFSSGLLINEIGSYSGSVPMQSGPSILAVEADGNWTLSVD
ncbi:NINE protein [Nesterenkonia lacusekhoensis]